jgi:hypothetical protein
MNDTKKLLLTVVVAVVLVSLIVYGLGIVGEEALSVTDSSMP